MPNLQEIRTENQGQDSRAEHFKRETIAHLMQEFDRQRHENALSERQYAVDVGVARTTLKYWRNRRERLQASPAALAFFESPEGVEFLHRFVVASHFVMTWMGTCGIRLICMLIELTGLGPFIADSYGAQQSVSAEVQEALVRYGEEEQERLATGMPHKKITACEDETFLSEGICLVAMEPASGFILLEDYVEQRDAETWDTKMAKATKGLDFEVIQAAEEETARQLDRIRKNRLGWRAAVHGIEELYHPFNLDSGAPQPADKVSEGLESRFDVIMKIAEEEGLSEACRDRIRKARRVVPKMVSTVAFFHGEVQRRIEDLRLPPDQERLVMDNLIPSAYLQSAASKTQDHDKKARLRKTLDELQSERLFLGGPASHLTAEEQRTLEKTAYECAEVFQRSSSCIEGRNGLLELWEHAMRRLQPKKLRGLTVVHNFFIKRPDGMTAAERFFGRPPRDLFDWLLAHVRLPARSAMKRKIPLRLSLLQCS